LLLAYLAGSEIDDKKGVRFFRMKRRRQERIKEDSNILANNIGKS
jgi:hypothetical protein